MKPARYQVWALAVLALLAWSGCDKKESTAGDAAFIHGTDGHPTAEQVEALVPLALDYLFMILGSIRSTPGLPDINALAGCASFAPPCAYVPAQIELVHNDLRTIATEAGRRNLRAELAFRNGSDKDPRPSDPNGEPQTDVEASIDGNRVTLFIDNIRETSTVQDLISGDLLARIAGILAHEFGHYILSIGDHQPRPPFTNVRGAQEGLDLLRFVVSATLVNRYRQQLVRDSGRIASIFYTSQLIAQGPFSFLREEDRLTLTDQASLLTLPPSLSATSDGWASVVMEGRPGACGEVVLRYRGPGDQNYLLAMACVGDGNLIPLGFTRYFLLQSTEGAGNERFTWLLWQTIRSPTEGAQLLKFTTKGTTLQLQVDGACVLHYEHSPQYGPELLERFQRAGAAGVRGQSLSNPPTSVQLSGFMTGNNASLDAKGTCQLTN